MKKTERISEKRVYNLAYDMLLMNWGKRIRLFGRKSR